MKTRKKSTFGKVLRVLAAILVAGHAFLTIAIPQTAKAFSGGGTGTAGNPYRITSCNQLSEMNNSSDHFLLRSNLNCSSVSFSPIQSFQGTFDGRNHEIGYINYSNGGDNVGLFDTLANATIKNFTMAHSTFQGQNYVGSIAGLAGTGTTISNVGVSTGIVTGTSAVGGLVGQASSGAAIAASSYDGSFNATTSNGGGITGYLTGGATVNNSYANVTGDGATNIGGITGYIMGSASPTSINRSYATGTLSAGTNRGGLIGAGTHGGSGTSSSLSYNVMIVNANGGSAISGSTILGSMSTIGNYYDATVLGYTDRCFGGTSSAICNAINTNGSDNDHYKNTSTLAPMNNWNFTTIWQKNTTAYPTLRTATLDALDPAVAPGVVSNVHTTPGDARVNLWWDAPAEDGGGEITDYQFSYRAAGTSTWTDTHTNSTYPFVTSFGFANGDHYDFRVAATNSAGTGEYVELLNQIIGTAPGTVQNIQVANAGDHANLSWEAPVSAGGTAIDLYRVAWKLHEASDWAGGDQVDTADISTSVNDLPAGMYDFRVRAHNQIDYGEWTTVENIAVGVVSHTVSSCQDLQNIQDDTAGNYTLTQDINCYETQGWNDDGDGGYYGFEPISNFTGTLNGGNYTISGLYIHRLGSCNQGLFDTLQGGSTVQDLVISNINLSAACDSAPLASYALGGSTITNVSTSGSVAVSYGAGGIVGIAESDDEGGITIANSSSNVTFAASDEDHQETVGGIVGYVYSHRSTITLLSNQAVMNISNSSGNAYRIAGMVGGADLYDDGQLVIDGAEVSGAITAHSTLAGLVGQVSSNWNGVDGRPRLTITDNQVIMNMFGKSDVGGLLSHIEANGIDVSIENSSYQGYSEALDNGYIGGLVARMIEDGGDPSLTITTSHVGAELNGANFVGGLVADTDVQATIDNSYYQGTLTGGNWIGGLVARGPVSIGHSYAAGAIDSPTGMQLGGLVGEMVDGLIGDSFASMSLNSSWLTVGGAIGAIDNGVVNVWIDAQIAGASGCNSVYAPEGIITYNCNPMNQENSDSEYFRGNSTNTPLDTWDFDNIWNAQNGEYPTLRANNGNSEPIYDVSNCTELQGMNNDLDGDYQLMNNIDCSGSEDWDNGQGFLPIASGHMEGFTGTLNGNGHTISNLTINRPDLYYVGLFESLNGTQVASFNIVNANITGGQLVGGVVAMGYDAGIFDINVSNSTITSTIPYNGMDAGTGGIAGSLFADGEGMYGMAEDSFQGSVNGFYNVGGLVGIMGYNALFDSYAQADVTGSTFVGGLIGNAGYDYIVNSYASGSVTSTGGGESGSWAGGLLGSGFELAIEDSFAASTVTAADDPVFGGGLIGTMDPNVQLNNTYFNSEAGSGRCGYDQYGANDYVDNEGCIAIDLADDPSYFFDNNANAPLDQWDFEDVWKTNVDSYPTFQGQEAEQVYNITTCDELQGMDGDLDGDYTLVNDIDCSDTATWNEGLGFSPIGRVADTVFSGTLNGNGHTITGLTINLGEVGDAGLLNSGFNAEIGNLKIDQADITGFSAAGTISGSSSNTYIHEVQVTNSSVTTTHGGDTVTGGLVGSYSGNTEGATIYASSFSGSVNGSNAVGGLIGSFISGALVNTYANATVTADNNVGGVAGMAIAGSIYNSYATGTVALSGEIDDAIAGGLVGSGGAITLYNDFAANDITSPIEATTNSIIGNIWDTETITIASVYYDTAKTHVGSCGQLGDSGNCIGIDTTEQPGYFFNPDNAPMSGWAFGGSPWVSHQVIDAYPDFGGAPIGANIHVTRTTTSITSFWEYPDDNGSAIDEYQLRYKLQENDDWINVNLDTPTDTQATVSGLLPGTGYTFYLRAHNASGWSEWRGYIPYTLDNPNSNSVAKPVAAQSAPATPLASTILPASAIIQQVAPDQAKTILDDYDDYTSGNGKSFTLSVGQVIYFYTNGELHSATVKEIGEDYVILTIASEPFDVRLSAGESKDVSVLQNDNKDVRITLKSIDNGKASVTFARINPEDKLPAQQKPSVNSYLWFLLLLIPVGYIVANRRKHQK